ncbi:hypothetical protein Palpr_1015 [Paludibacter propionicigenes WB4]|uniref:Secreted protein n=1 Tax=Paludibacter propionicigenes (strain DSM 17365 / JCM 13257 / WB4) TaxID=694427 RepID=E4T370_PALPW|nr:hypothetical protein [Paludibacter propionicigenes]ADQ79164.1 hypothetical protein Palpr_1015 [Paludibacter propionicigenes WB4]
MKKIFSILFAALILLSGMHLSLATHLCGGEISAVKLSFDHEKAGCGMCSTEANSGEKSIAPESCCKDEISFLAVDNNYSPSTIQIYHTANQLLQVFDIPQTIGIVSIHTNSATNANVQQPGNYIAAAVSLPDICVFRI